MEDLLQQIMLKAYEINKNTKHSVSLFFSRKRRDFRSSCLFEQLENR